MVLLELGIYYRLCCFPIRQSITNLAYRVWNECDVYRYLGTRFEHPLVRLHHVVARRGRLDLVRQVPLGGVADHERGLELASCVVLDRREAQVLLGIDNHDTNG